MNDTEIKTLLSRNPNHPKHGVPVPLILICNVSGKETKYTAPEYIKSKIEAAGSLEALLKGYICKGAGKNAAGATKAPTTRQWKGKDIVQKEGEEKAAEKSGPVDRIHREFKFDGGTCNVYHDRQNSEQATEIEHDLRKKKVAQPE